MNVRKTAHLLGLLASWALLAGFGPYRPSAAGSAALGLADSQVASGTGSAALYANPAGMSQVRQGIIELGYARDPNAGADGLFATYVDSTSEWGIAMGVGYTHLVGWSFDQPRRDGYDLRLGASLGSQSESGAFLFGGSARKVDAGGTGKGGRRASGWTGDAGMTFGTGNLRVGAVVQNITQLDPLEAPRRLATGVAYVSERVMVELDGSWGLVGDTKGEPSAGGQAYRLGAGFVPTEEGLQLRVGYAFDDMRSDVATRHWLAGGLGWRTTRVTLDAGVQIDVGGSQEVVVGASLGLVLPYDLN